jgi:deoxyribose-phosphate aldolase
MLIQIKQLAKDYKLLAGMSDHTSLQPPEAAKYQIPGKNPVEEREKDLRKFIAETILDPLGYYGICIRGVETKIGRKMIDEAQSKLQLVVTSAGFPNLTGYVPLGQKIAEVIQALDDGADEVDTVMNWRQLKERELIAIEKETYELSKYAHRYGKKHKVIFEVCNLSDNEIITASRISEENGADFVKTSTGFSKGGATPQALRLMRANFTRSIKPAGGVNLDNIETILEAMSGRTDGMFEYNPCLYRIGESSLLKVKTKAGY